MAKDWKGELKEIVTSQQKSIKKVIDDRDKRESERLNKIDEIKKIIKPRFEFIKELIDKDKYLITPIESAGEPEKRKISKLVMSEPGEAEAAAVLTSGPGEEKPAIVGGKPNEEFIEQSKRGELVPNPKINESATELVLIMPSLSDVNRLDLMYQIEFQEEKPVVHAYHLLPSGKMESQGSAHDKFEDFIQDTMKRFLLSWFTRKEGTERDKERKFELHIIGHGLKD
jgi:hypothetical protein